MPRRVSLPGADELFRPTAEVLETSRPMEPSVEPAPVDPALPDVPAAASDRPTGGQRKAVTSAADRRSSGRIRHEEKMTVYVTADELIDLEHARLTLRRDAGLAVDRGRLVREAIAIALADIEAHGAGAEIVRRLSQA